MSVTARRIATRRSEDEVRALRVPVTVSIGVAVYPDNGSTAAAVLGAADDALYAAKAAGRDTYRLARRPTRPVVAPVAAPVPAAVPAPVPAPVAAPVEPEPPAEADEAAAQPAAGNGRVLVFPTGRASGGPKTPPSPRGR